MMDAKLVTVVTSNCLFVLLVVGTNQTLEGKNLYEDGSDTKVRTPSIFLITTFIQPT